MKNTSKCIACHLEKSCFTGTADTMTNQAVQISSSGHVILVTRSEDFHEDRMDSS